MVRSSVTAMGRRPLAPVAGPALGNADPRFPTHVPNHAVQCSQLRVQSPITTPRTPMTMPCLVEAAGIEPASRKDCATGFYVRIPWSVFDLPSPTDRQGSA